MQKIVLTFAAAALAAAASAYTVYDAGKALRQNCASGAPVGADGATYTDENGGVWKYSSAAGVAPSPKKVSQKVFLRGVLLFLLSFSFMTMLPLFVVHKVSISFRDPPHKRKKTKHLRF